MSDGAAPALGPTLGKSGKARTRVLIVLALAVMTVALATAAVLSNVTSGVAIAALAVVRKVFRLHPVVTLQTASRPLPGLRARCLCRAMRKSAQHVLHVEAFQEL